MLPPAHVFNVILFTTIYVYITICWEGKLSYILDDVVYLLLRSKYEGFFWQITRKFTLALPSNFAYYLELMLVSCIILYNNWLEVELLISKLIENIC